MSMETYVLRVDTPRVDDVRPSLSSRQQLVIGYDLYRAIEELRSVPVLRWPDEVRLDDGIASDADDRAEYGSATTNASRSDTVARSQLSNHDTTSTTLNAVSSRRSCTTQADDDNAGRPTSAANGDLANRLVDQAGRSVGKHVQTGAHDHCSSARQPAPGDGSERLSDNVFFDEMTPIDADLLIDDVYEREMDELDQQLDVEVIAADDARDWPDLLPESDGFGRQRYQNSADIHTNSLLIESSTDRRLEDVMGQSAECNRSGRSTVEVHRTDVHPESVHLDKSSSVTYRSNVSSFIDTSAEELFEEIVESMTNAVSEDDSELDEQLIEDATNTNFGRRKLTVCRQNIVSEKFVDDTVTSPAKPLTWPSNRLSRSSHRQDASEKKRQKDLTVSLASTLNECLKALSRTDASVRRTGDVRRDSTGVERRRKYDTRDSDVMSSWSSTMTSPTNSEDRRRCVTSSSSGFQSDLMDVDIDEEFDANAAYDDADLRATRPTAESTSLDSLLDLNDDDDDEESYSAETIIRRPTAPHSQRLDNQSVVNGFVVPSRNTVKTGTNTTSVNRTQGIIAPELDQDDDRNKKNSSVVAYDDKSPKVEVLAEELITQEIVLNIILPRRSKKNKTKAAVGGRVDRMESAESGIVNRRNSDKAPHRDFHIHRIVRCSDADDRCEDPLAISERPQSQRQKSVGERTEEAEIVGGVDEDDGRLGSSSRRSLAARYVGGPLSVELERNAESATTERLDDETSLRVTRRNRVKVLRAPARSGDALFSAPVTGVGHVVDDVRRTLVGVQQRQSLPPGVRVTCDAVERKSSTSLPVDDVTVVRRIIVDDGDRH